MSTASSPQPDDQPRFRALLQHASDSVAVIDAAGAITFVTDSIEPLLGHRPASLEGRLVERLVAQPDRPRLAELLAAAHATPDAVAGEIALLHRDGHLVHAELTVADRLADPGVAGVVLTVRDVSELRRLESQLRLSALRDRHTGLPNRACFEQWLHEALARGPAAAAVVIDIDDLTTVNESLGHAAGDRCLEACAARLRDAVVSGGGRLARVGGDEFAALFETAGEAEELALGLIAAVSGVVQLDGADVPLTASAGVALAGPADTPEDLLRCAYTAAHVATARGPGQVEVYVPAMRARAMHRLARRAALARGLTA